MLASFFQFSFLCVVALANLCLGFAIASRLGFGPSIAAFFEVGPRRELASTEVDESVGETASETVGASNSPNDESSDVKHADEVEPRESDAEAQDEPVATVESEDPIESVCDLLQGHCDSLEELRKRLAPDGSPLTSSDVEGVAEELAESTQVALQELNACTDRIKQAADAESEGPDSEATESENQLTTELAEVGSKINDGLARLADLNYDDESLDDSIATLQTTIDDITGHCDATKNQVEALVATV